VNLRRIFLETIDINATNQKVILKKKTTIKNLNESAPHNLSRKRH
jgi:hypothetical protein